MANPEQLDLFPTQGRAIAAFAILVCERYRGTKRAAETLAASAHGLARAKLAAVHLRQPVLVIDALAAYAGCSRDDLLAGRAVLPAFPATEAA